MSNISESDKELLWNHHENTGIGVCMVCDECGGGSASFCACARKAYFSSKISDEDLELLRELKRGKQEVSDSDRQLLWDYERKTMAGIAMVCPKCKESSAAWCECSRKKFFSSELSQRELKLLRRLKGEKVENKEEKKQAKHPDLDKMSDFELNDYLDKLNNESEIRRATRDFKTQFYDVLSKEQFERLKQYINSL